MFITLNESNKEKRKFEVLVVFSHLVVTYRSGILQSETDFIQVGCLPSSLLKPSNSNILSFPKNLEPIGHILQEVKVKNRFRHELNMTEREEV